MFAIPHSLKRWATRLHGGGTLSNSMNSPFETKRAKLERIRPLLAPGRPFTETAWHFDFLTEDLKSEYDFVETENVSENQYDRTALSIIEACKDGLVLDCGAGRRSTYYDNVVNLEIVPYDSTDVVAVGEELPFRDGSFDAVFSLAVLEHVKDPFQCAREILRVMKPRAKLYCGVPFLPPCHGYPHHYYHMTHQGLRNLFEAELEIEKQDVIPSGVPI